VAGGQALELLLSAEGGFVRDILLDELAKGADATWRLALDSAVASARGGLLALLGARARLRPPWECGDAAMQLHGTPSCS